MLSSTRRVTGERNRRPATHATFMAVSCFMVIQEADPETGVTGISPPGNRSPIVS